MRFRMLLVLSALLLAGLVRSCPPAAPTLPRCGPGTVSRNCESGGRWHVATGNGYFGGLQFSSSTWRAFGGEAVRRAPPTTPRRTQQVRVAERVRSAGLGRLALMLAPRRAALTR